MPVRVAQVMGKMVGGGLEAVVMNYYRHIDRRRVQFDFLVDADSTVVPRDEIQSLGGRVYVIPPYQRARSNAVSLTDLLRTESWPIIHAHMNALSVLPLRTAWRAGVPVRIAHSHSTWGRGELCRNILKALLRTQANRYPTHRLACGRRAGTWLFGRHADFAVMRNAVETCSFAFSSERRMRVRSELGIGAATFVVGHIGRFVTQKNHGKLIDIFCELRHREPDSLLVLAGEGPLMPEVARRVAEFGLDGSVLLLGRREDPEALYSAFDCLCLPSRYEGLPLVGVEAQAAALPLIVSDVVSDELAITSRCHFVALGAPSHEWADAVLACRDPGRTLSDADASALRRYDIAANAASLLSYYEEALAGAHMRPCL